MKLSVVMALDSQREQEIEMKILLSVIMLAIVGCSSSSKEWQEVVLDGMNDCKAGSTAALTYITTSLNKGVEFSCSWVVPEAK